MRKGCLFEYMYVHVVHLFEGGSYRPALGVPTIRLRSPGFYKAPSPWVSCELTLIWTGPFLVHVQCTYVTNC